MVSLSKNDKIFILSIPKSFTLEICQQIHQQLDIIEQAPGPKAYIVTGSNQKLFNGGMDLQALVGNGPEYGFALFSACMQLWGRMMSLGVPSVAAINGPCIAAGLMTALSCDYRLMKQENGKVAMTEIQIGMPLPEGGSGILRQKLHPSVVRDLILRGITMEAQECLDKQIVDELVTGSNLMNRALTFANTLVDFGGMPEVYKCLKEAMYRQIIPISKEGAFNEEEKEASRKYAGFTASKISQQHFDLVKAFIPIYQNMSDKDKPNSFSDMLDKVKNEQKEDMYSLDQFGDSKKESKLKVKWKRIKNKLFGAEGVSNRFVMGIQIGATVGGIFGGIAGALMYMKTKKFLYIPMTAITMACSFGFFLGIGTLVRTDDSEIDVSSLHAVYEEGKWTFIRKEPEWMSKFRVYEV